MSKTIQRPVIEVNRVFAAKRSAMDAFVTVLVKELERRSIRTFEVVEQPHYTFSESEVNRYDTNT